MGKYYYKSINGLCVEECPIDNTTYIGSGYCSDCEYCENHKYIVCPHLPDYDPIPEEKEKISEDLLQEIIDIINQSDLHVPEFITGVDPESPEYGKELEEETKALAENILEWFKSKQ